MKKYAGHSFVVISSSNYKLNKLNEQLIGDLIDEEKQVVKAIEPSKSHVQWKFLSVN